jgi:hypothetical protein
MAGPRKLDEIDRPPPFYMDDDAFAEEAALEGAQPPSVQQANLGAAQRVLGGAPARTPGGFHKLLAMFGERSYDHGTEVHANTSDGLDVGAHASMQSRNASVHADAGFYNGPPSASAEGSLFTKGGSGIGAKATIDAGGVRVAASVQIHSVKFGVILRNGALIEVTLNLGPNHPKLNTVLHWLSRGGTAALSGPWGVAADTGLRILQWEVDRHRQKKDERALPTAATPTTPAAAPTGANFQGMDVCSFLTMEDCGALRQSGLLGLDGTPPPTVNLQQCFDGLPLDESQRLALWGQR